MWTARRRNLIAAGCLAAVAATTSAIAQTSPSIDGFTPTSGAPGTLVRIDVSSFGTPLGGADYGVGFNAAAGTFLEAAVMADSTDPQGQIVTLYAVVPPQGTTGPIAVTLPDPSDPTLSLTITSSDDFEVIPLAGSPTSATESEIDRPAGPVAPRVTNRLMRRAEERLFGRGASGTAFGGLFARLRQQLSEQIERAMNGNRVEASVDADNPPVLFRRLGTANFTSELANSPDVVVADFDDDDDADVFVPQSSCGGCPDGDTLYVNDGNDLVNNPDLGVVVGVVTGDLTPKHQAGTSVADLDGDGYPDVVPPLRAPTEDVSRIRMLINNDGDGTFEDEFATRVTNDDELTLPEQLWNDVEFGDLDGDGDLDVALANRCTAAVCGSDGASAFLIDEGPSMPGTYTAYPQGFGEPLDEVHHDVLLCDLNDDDLADVVFSKDFVAPMAPLTLGLNAGGAPPTFTNASSALAPNPAAHTLELGCGDFDGDGDMDLHVGVVARSDRDATDIGYREDLIYLNLSEDGNGDGKIDETELRLEAVSAPEVGAAWGQGFDALTNSADYDDFDGDGDLDILVGSLSPDPTSKGPYLMLNEGQGTFVNVSEANEFWPAATSGQFEHFNPTAPAVGDLNDDGYVDVVFSMGGLKNGRFDEANRIFIQEAPPTAEICDDVKAECAGETTDVELDGSCSSDPENGELTYQWSSDDCTFDDDTAEKPTASCPLGNNLVSLVVTDPTGLSSEPDEAMVIIEDTTPPTIDVSVSPDELWPPNHRMRLITANVEVDDVCDPDPQVTLVSVTSNEPDNSNGDGNTRGDIQSADIGTDDRVIQLRAERKGNGDGRVYTIVYDVTDASGNGSDDTAYVTVPHDRGNNGGSSDASADPPAPSAPAWRWIRLRP